MNPEVTKLLSDLANKMGTSVEYLWPLLVRREFVGAMIGLTFGALLIIVSLAVSLSGWRKLTKCEARKIPYSRRSADQDNEVTGLRFYTFLPMVGVFIGALLIAGFIGDALVPEAAALQSIVRLVH